MGKGIGREDSGILADSCQKSTRFNPIPDPIPDHPDDAGRWASRLKGLRQVGNN